MSGRDNLKPFNTLTPERRHELAVKGGKARAEQRRQQRAEVNRIKAEEIAMREVDEASSFALYKACKLLYQAALLTGDIKRRRK